MVAGNSVQIEIVVLAGLGRLLSGPWVVCGSRSLQPGSWLLSAGDKNRRHKRILMRLEHTAGRGAGKPLGRQHVAQLWVYIPYKCLRDQCLVAVQDQLTLPWRVQRLKQRLVSLEVQFADVRRIPQGALILGESGSHRCVIEASAVRLPSIGMEISDGS